MNGKRCHLCHQVDHLVRDCPLHHTIGNATILTPKSILCSSIQQEIPGINAPITIDKMSNITSLMNSNIESYSNVKELHHASNKHQCLSNQSVGFPLYSLPDQSTGSIPLHSGISNLECLSPASNHSSDLIRITSAQRREDVTTSTTVPTATNIDIPLFCGTYSDPILQLTSNNFLNELGSTTTSLSAYEATNFIWSQNHQPPTAIHSSSFTESLGQSIQRTSNLYSSTHSQLPKHLIQSSISNHLQPNSHTNKTTTSTTPPCSNNPPCLCGCISCTIYPNIISDDRDLWRNFEGDPSGGFQSADFSNPLPSEPYFTKIHSFSCVLSHR